ncbi:hypothetical protein [Altibacter sp. HG106]|uniref:hypothetical protein n=1 Tax=Altibacter sp. HG106 TaxID=3023937 RepID=UPI0023505792|nr:hypothetical protein [Altibacter sp. HG106]MDC7996037.1 hypothetical protein [Altibacter sp. HG106]
MKNRIAFLSILLTYVFFVAACSKDDDNSNGNTPNDNGTVAQQTATVADTGTWQVTLFIDSDEDETSDFNGYVFTFDADGSVVADNGTTSISGTWSITDSSSSSDDDGSSSDDDFNLFFSVPDTSDFEDLNDDWDIVSVSGDKIELLDISGGNGGTDRLIFEKL